jgi:hypothetical protein
MWENGGASFRELGLRIRMASQKLRPPLDGKAGNGMIFSEP